MDNLDNRLPTLVQAVHLDFGFFPPEVNTKIVSQFHSVNLQ